MFPILQKFHVNKIFKFNEIFRNLTHFFSSVETSCKDIQQNKKSLKRSFGYMSKTFRES